LRLADLSLFRRYAAAAESIRIVFDVYTIIFLALAVFIFLRLRSVLGQRTGRERPPYDPYSARDAARPAGDRPAGDRSAGDRSGGDRPGGDRPGGDRSGGDKVVPLPSRGAEGTQRPAEPAEPDPAERWKGIAEAGSTVAAGLDAIAHEDKSFDPKHFVTGARAAYEMIVSAFAEGDRRSLKNLLGREVYEGFESAIGEREKRGETTETKFVSIDKADIVNAELRGRAAQVTVRFVSQLISSTRDRNGNVIDGSAEKVTDVTDVWTFARDVSSRDPNWKLVATEAGQ
jgi:predicted lipid-binding transport protein (Tim44 family)